MTSPSLISNPKVSFRQDQRRCRTRQAICRFSFWFVPLLQCPDEQCDLLLVDNAVYVLSFVLSRFLRSSHPLSSLSLVVNIVSINALYIFLAYVLHLLGLVSCPYKQIPFVKCVPMFLCRCPAIWCLFYFCLLFSCLFVRVQCR